METSTLPDDKKMQLEIQAREKIRSIEAAITASVIAVAYWVFHGRWTTIEEVANYWNETMFEFYKTTITPEEVQIILGEAALWFRSENKRKDGKIVELKSYQKK